MFWGFFGVVGCFKFFLRSAYTEARHFLHHQQGHWGSTRSWGWEGHSQGSWPQLAKGYSIPYDVMLSIQTWTKKEGIGGHSKCWHLSTQVTVTCDGVWLFLEMPVQEKRWMNFLLCHAYMALASPFKLLLTQHTSFPAFTLLILSTSHQAIVSEQLCGA